MIVSPLKSGFACALLALIPSVAVHAAPPQAVDLSSQNDGQATTTRADTEGGDQAVQTDAPRRTYFLGSPPQDAALIGPPAGTPKSVQPQPYVSPDALVLPPAPVAERADMSGPEAGDAEGLDAVSDDQDADGDIVAPDVASTDTALTGTVPAGGMDAGSVDQGINPDSEGLQVAETTEDATVDASADASGTAAETAIETLRAQAFSYEEAALESFDPSLQAASLWSAGSEGSGQSQAAQPTAFLFDGLSRNEAIDVLKALGVPNISHSLRSFARDIALGNFALPASDDQAEIDRLLAARLDVLRALGSPAGFVALIDALPSDRDWSGLSRYVADAYFLGGRLADACALADTRRSTDTDPYWVKVAVFCAAMAGDRSAVDFQLDILDTVIRADSHFVTLADQILLVAEAEAAGSAAPEAAPLGTGFKPSVLTAAMAKLAGAPILDMDMSALDPVVLELLMSLDGVDSTMRAALLRRAVDSGLASTALITAFLETAALDAAASQPDTVQPGGLDDPGTGESDLQTAETDPGVDLNQLARQAVGLRGDTPLADRMATLEGLWDNTVAASLQVQLAPVLADILRPIIPQPLAGRQAAIMVRIYFTAGDRARALEWLDALRASFAGRDMARDAAFARLVPLMVAAGGVDVAQMPLDFDRWWGAPLAQETASQDDPGRSGLNYGPTDPAGSDVHAAPSMLAKAGLILSLVEAQGRPVPEVYWQKLEAVPGRLTGILPRPASWRHFVIASHQGRRAAMLGAVYRIVDQHGLATMPAVLAGALYTGLSAQAMGPLADQIMIDMLVASGL